MRLLGSTRSPFVRKVRVVAAECGIDLPLVQHSVHLASVTPDIMALNPLGKIPGLLQDGHRPLFDSLVICAELCHRAGRKDLWPEAPGPMIEMLRYHAIGAGLMDLSILRLVEAAKPPERQWPEVINASDDKFLATLDVLENDEEFQATETSVGTLSIAVALGYLDFRMAFLNWRDKRPQLAGWFAKVSARPSMRDFPFQDTDTARAGQVR